MLCLRPMAVAAAMLAGLAPVAKAEVAGACDTLAASPFDAARPADVPGVRIADIDLAAAMAACTSAQAADPQNPRLAFQLGRVFQVAGEDDKALALYRQAADMGYAVAMVNVGIFLEDSAPAEARVWYARAADLGQMLGQYNLGVLYQNGVGGAVDVEKALAYYQMASDQGDAVAAFNIAVLHDEGELIPRDAARAVTYYRLAVARGNIDAMVNLAFMAEAGDGMPADTSEARRLFEQAAALGDAEAAAEAARLAAAP